MAARRYRCVGCAATVTVLPGGVAQRFLYRLAAIGWALWRWGVQRATVQQVRTQLSPLGNWGFCRPERWLSLPRWVRCARRLWPAAPRAPTDSTARQGAALVARALASLALPPPLLPTAEDAWQGATAA